MPIQDSYFFFAQKFGVSDPLPPTAAVPLCKGDNKLILPLEKGESRRRRGVAHTESLCKAHRSGVQPHFRVFLMVRGSYAQ
jgi:hypothetical protein